jgi:hypothetical protein
VVFAGERYGWVLDEFSEELLNMYPWMDQYKGRSVTELEIRHSVLNHSVAPLGFDGSGEEMMLQRKRIEDTVANSVTKRPSFFFFFFPFASN